MRPSIEYATPVWCFRATQDHLDALDVLQARVWRRILLSSNIPFDRQESKENLNKMCQVESLQWRRQVLSLVILFKYIHSRPDYLATFHITITKSARRPNKLVFNRHGRALSSMFLFRIGTLWNCLPPQTTAILCLADFLKSMSSTKLRRNSFTIAKASTDDLTSTLYVFCSSALSIFAPPVPLTPCPCVAFTPPSFTASSNTAH